MSNSNAKVWGYHAESNTKVELESGFSFISFDGTRYVVGGWEKNRKTGAAELAVFEADDDKVYLGKEERVPAGEVLELAENPFHTIQFDWQYVKAKVESDDAYENGNVNKYSAVEEAKKRMEIARKENEKRKQQLAQELEKSVVMQKADPVSQVESYDRRPSNEVEKQPSDELVNKKLNEAMDDLVLMQEELVEKKSKTQPISKAVNQISEVDDEGYDEEDDEDDDFFDDDDDDDDDEDIEDIDNWLEKVEQEVASNNKVPIPPAKEVERKTSKQVSATKPVQDVGKKDYKHEKKYRKEAKRIADEVDEEILEHMNPEEKDTNSKNFKKLEAEYEARFEKINDRIARVQEELKQKSFRLEETSVSNSPVAQFDKPILKDANAEQFRVGAQERTFGTRIAALQSLDENKIIQNAELINFICGMDEATKHVLLTVANQMALKNGKCNIIVL